MIRLNRRRITINFSYRKIIIENLINNKKMLAFFSRVLYNNKALERERN